MRVLRIIASADLSGGGPIEGVVRVGEALRARGVEQDVATVDAPDAPFLPQFPARVFALGQAPGTGILPRRLQSRLHYAPRAVPWLRTHATEYDAIIVSGLWHYATAAARRALVGGSTPYVVFTHGMLDPWFNRAYPAKAAIKRVLWRLNEGPLLRDAAAVLFTSEEERLSARASFRPYRLTERVVAYGTKGHEGDPVEATRSFRAAMPALGDRPFLLFLSRIHQKKGCDLLIEAFAAVASLAPDLDLVIAGPDQKGWRATLEARAMALGIDRRIHWPGMLAGVAKQGAFAACDAFVLPSHQENFGIVVAEALAAGRPVLTTDKVNIWREILADGAALIGADTQEGVTALLTRFLALSPAERTTMAGNARICFERRFEIGRAADDLIAVLEEARGPRRAA